MICPLADLTNMKFNPNSTRPQIFKEYVHPWYEYNDDQNKPKYAKLRKGQTLESIDLKSALDLFSLPRNLGEFESKDIIVSEGKYGPYIRYNNKFISLVDHNPITVSLNTCVEIIKNHPLFIRICGIFWVQLGTCCQLFVGCFCITSCYQGSSKLIM